MPEGSANFPTSPANHKNKMPQPSKRRRVVVSKVVGVEERATAADDTTSASSSDDDDNNDKQDPGSFPREPLVRRDVEALGEPLARRDVEALGERLLSIDERIHDLNLSCDKSGTRTPTQAAEFVQLQKQYDEIDLQLPPKGVCLEEYYRAVRPHRSRGDLYERLRNVPMFQEEKCEIQHQLQWMELRQKHAWIWRYMGTRGAPASSRLVRDA